VFFVILLLAALVTTAFMIRVKTPDLMLEVVTMTPRKFEPDGDGLRDGIKISFFVREDEPDARVEIVSTYRQKPIRALDRHLALAANVPVEFTWDGIRNNGKLAAPGGYRLRVTMPSLGRVIEFPRRFFIEGMP